MYAISQLRPMGISILHTLGNINYWQYTKISPEMLLKSTKMSLFFRICKDLTFIIGREDQVEIFKKSFFFRRPPTLEAEFFIDPPQQVQTFS